MREKKKEALKVWYCNVERTKKVREGEENNFTKDIEELER